MNKLSFAFLLIGSAFLLFACEPAPPEKPEHVFCTAETKLCPDGSYVGRQGPYCEFASCPEVKPADDGDGYSEDLETYSDDKLSFNYPADFGSEYITGQSWPPKVTVAAVDVFSCDGEAREINGQGYCVNSETEGAAGSTYTTYKYSSLLEAENSVLTIEFTLRSVECANYDEPKKTECETAQAALNVDQLVDQITQSVQLGNLFI